MNLEHPIVFDPQYNICDLVRDIRLKNVKLVLQLFEFSWQLDKNNRNILVCMC